jgi:hypothetical protein
LGASPNRLCPDQCVPGAVRLSAFRIPSGHGEHYAVTAVTSNSEPYPCLCCHKPADQQVAGGQHRVALSRRQVCLPTRRSRSPAKESLPSAPSARRAAESHRGNVAPRGMSTSKRATRTRPFSWKPSGAMGIRTPDLLHAMEARYQLRHSPAPRTRLDNES